MFNIGSQTLGLPIDLHNTASPPPPWEKWDLDENFLKSLSVYCLKHPQTTLDRILDNICHGIENGRELLEVIPDGPLPARGLVKALAHLIKLGVTVSRTRATVYDFSKQVVYWVGQVKLAFEMSGNRHFTRITWHNLRKMRDLVEEICQWACTRLNDGRWSRIGRGLKIAKEIEDFSKRIDHAKTLFRDLTMINLSGGLGAILEIIRMILHRQDKLANLIEDIKEEHRKQMDYIIDDIEARRQASEAQRQAETRRLFLERTLNPRVVTNATYDQQGRNPCDENTRVEVLAEITRWANDVSGGSRNFLWLTGDPGCGKSAITASIARNCKDKGVLWAQFFINRNNVDTTDPNSYFPSIARQLANNSSAVENAIYDRLMEKRSLMDRISAEQAAKLFVDALKVASKQDPKKTVAVMIDGLDETDRKRLKDTAVIFSHLFQELAQFPNVKVLVSSRTEDEIRNPFAHTMKDEHVNHIHLDTRASIDDVSSFLKRRIIRIVVENDLNWEEWPGEERMATLAARAAGLFIWAATVTKFLQEQIDTQGTECLDGILDALTGEALEDINALYHMILRITYNNQMNAWDFEKFRRIVGAIVVLREPLCIQDLRELLDLRQNPSSSRVDIVKFVRRLRTVLVAGASAVNETTVPRLHKSFFEFIISQETEAKFRVDPDVSEAELALCSLRQLHRSYTATVGQSQMYSSLPGQVRYASRFWPSHLYQVEGGSSGVLIGDATTRLHDLQRLICRSSNRNRSGPLSMSLSAIRSQISTSSPGHNRVWDAAYTMLTGHANAVNSVAFSPDGQQLVSGSEDRNVILWNISKGLPTKSVMRGHTAVVRSVAFSSAGDRIASGSGDRTVRIWNPKTLKTIAQLGGHTGSVFSIAFSPDGSRIASGDNHAIHLWDAFSGNHVARTAHPGLATSIAFSPNGKQIIYSYENGCIWIWKIGVGDPIPTYINSARDATMHSLLSMAISADGRQVVTGDRDQVHFWTKEKGRLVASEPSLRVDCTFLWSVALSPDGRFLAAGHDKEPNTKVWDLQARQAIPLPSVGQAQEQVLSVAFSPDSSKLACASSRRSIRLWDVPGVMRSYDEPRVSFTAFSPSGTLTVAVLVDNSILLWDAKRTRAIGKYLPGNDLEDDVRHVSFAEDDTQIAAATANTVYLWDVSQKLLASTVQDIVPSILSLSFTTGGQALYTEHEDGSFHVWNEIEGELVATHQPPLPTLERDGPSFEEVEEGSPGASHLDGVRWYPAKTKEFGLWAYFEGHIIRGREDGSITVVPVDAAISK